MGAARGTGHDLHAVQSVPPTPRRGRPAGRQAGGPAGRARGGDLPPSQLHHRARRWPRPVPVPPLPLGRHVRLADGIQPVRHPSHARSRAPCSAATTHAAVLHLPSCKPDAASGAQGWRYATTHTCRRHVCRNADVYRERGQLGRSIDSPGTICVRQAPDGSSRTVVHMFAQVKGGKPARTGEEAHTMLLWCTLRGGPPQCCWHSVPVLLPASQGTPCFSPGRRSFAAANTHAPLAPPGCRVP